MHAEVLRCVRGEEVGFDAAYSVLVRGFCRLQLDAVGSLPAEAVEVAIFAEVSDMESLVGFPAFER